MDSRHWQVKIDTEYTFIAKTKSQIAQETLTRQSSMKRNTLGQLENFLRRRLKIKLRNDLRLLRITKEADIECCIYYHMRRTLPAKGAWTVLARKYVRRTEHYVDLLVLKNGRPRIAIEIKWNKNEMPDKDRHSLNSALKKMRVNKAYFVSAGPDIAKSRYRKLDKKPFENHRLHEVIVGLGYSDSKIKDWRSRRDLLGKRMRPGKAKPKIT